MNLEEKIKDAIEKDSICKWLSEQVNNVEPNKLHLVLELREIRKTEISDDLYNEVEPGKVT